MSSKVLLIFCFLVHFVWSHTNHQGEFRNITCTYIEDASRGYTCELSNFQYYDEKEEEKIRFFGQQQNGKFNEDVDYLYIHDSQTHYIPSEQIMYYFINLRKLEIRRSDIRKLTPIINGYSLELAILTHNGIKSLDAGIFVECPAMEILDLSNNEISKIHDNAFGSLKSIIDINLSHNRIQYLSRKIVKPLKNARKLNLRSNSLKELPHDIFNDLFHLTELDISENPLIRLDFRIFDFTVHVEDLKMSSLHVKTLHKFVFKNLRRLVTLDISDNDLKTLDGEVLSTNKNLVELAMKNCNINGIGRHFFDKLDSLRKTIAAGNICVNGEFEGKTVDYRPKFVQCFQNFDDMKSMMFLNKGGNHAGDEL